MSQTLQKYSRPRYSSTKTGNWGLLISSSTKYVIKVKDRHLHLINVAIPGFLNLDRALEGVQQVEPLFQYTAKDEVTPS